LDLEADAVEGNVGQPGREGRAACVHGAEGQVELDSAARMAAFLGGSMGVEFAQDGQEAMALFGGKDGRFHNVPFERGLKIYRGFRGGC
jgi:hypothetical protein